MRALVTGGAGFIGSHLVDALLGAGHTVDVVDDLSTGSIDNLVDASSYGSAFTFHHRDLTAPGLNAVVAAAAPDVVFHLAAQMDVRVSVREPLRDGQVNVLGTVAVLEAAARAGVGRLVFASSGGTIYGSPATQPVPESAPLLPLAPYGAAKAAAEPYLLAYRQLHGLDSVALALGNVYGPRQSPHGEAGVVAIFARALLAGTPAVVFGDGSAVRDYVHVEDVVRALVHFGTADVPRTPSGRINVGTGVGTTVRQLHTRLAAAVGVPDDVRFEPGRPGELAASTLDVSAAAERGWTPRIALAEGLPATVAWVRAHLVPAQRALADA